MQSFIISSPASIPGRRPVPSAPSEGAPFPRRNSGGTSEESTGDDTATQLQLESHLSTLSRSHCRPRPPPLSPVEWSLLACRARPTAAALPICRCFKPLSVTRCAVAEPLPSTRLLLQAALCLILPRGLSSVKPTTGRKDTIVSHHRLTPPTAFRPVLWRLPPLGLDAGRIHKPTARRLLLSSSKPRNRTPRTPTRCAGIQRTGIPRQPGASPETCPRGEPVLDPSALAAWTASVQDLHIIICCPPACTSHLPLLLNCRIPSHPRPR